jgi:Glycosyl hydrolase family 65, C-terminal domain
MDHVIDTPEGMAETIGVREDLARLVITATYTLLSGEPLEIEHHGAPITVTGDHPARCPIPPAPALERPTQPRGREPARRADR